MQRRAAVLVRALLRLFPGPFRERYAEEMLVTFRELLDGARRRGRLSAWAFLARTTLDLIGAAVRERLFGEGAWWPWHSPGASQPRSAAGSSGGFMERLGQDLRYGVRFLHRNPGFSLVVLLTLALGIGMNTAVFSVLYGVLYQPLPYPNPSTLVQVGRTHPAIPGAVLPTSPATYLDLKQRLRSVQNLEVLAQNAYVLTGEGEAGRYLGGATSAGFFDLLGVAPLLGRTFAPSDDQPGAEPVVVLSDGFWRTQLGGNPAVLGSTIRLNDTPHTVIGVMPPDFRFGSAVLWVPTAWDDNTRAIRSSNFLRAYARLAPGATIESASAEVEREFAPIRAELPLGNENTTMLAVQLSDLIARSTRTPLFILAGAAFFVLLIACANVANLMMVRAEHRQREVGVRAALGAGRERLVRQFLTESLLCSVLGAVAGLGVAAIGLRLLVAAFGSAIPRSQDIGMHAPVLIFTMVAALVTGVLVGVAPAFRSRPDFDALREGSRGGTARFSLLGRSLVVAQVALALMLVTGAGLLLKSYTRATRSDLGFSAANLVAVNLFFPPSRYADNAARAPFLDQLMARLEATPQIEATALSSMVPIREFGNNITELAAVGRGETRASFVETRFVTPQYFETMGIRLLSGRLPTDAEARDGAPVVLINRVLAGQLFGGEDPIGERLAITERYQPEVIGVVGDLRDFGPDQIPRPTFYGPANVLGNLMMRTRGELATTANVLRNVVQELDPEVAVVRIQTMQEIIDGALANRRFQLTLIAVFAATALLLACVGIYGVLSYTVARQTREIGVRMALGARAGAVAGQVALRGGRVALIGVLVGATGALALRKVIASQLFEVESFDPGVYVGVALLLLAVAAAACVIPARRAALVEPTQALRVE